MAFFLVGIAKNRLLNNNSVIFSRCLIFVQIEKWSFTCGSFFSAKISQLFSYFCSDDVIADFWADHSHLQLKTAIFAISKNHLMHSA